MDQINKNAIKIPCLAGYFMIEKEVPSRGETDVGVTIVVVPVVDVQAVLIEVTDVHVVTVRGEVCCLLPSLCTEG